MCFQYNHEMKENSCCKYAENITNLCKTSSRNLFKSVNSIRAKNYTGTIIINTKVGTLIINGKDKIAVWEEYFQELYNSIIITEHTYKANDNYIQEPETLHKKIETAIINSLWNKSPGVDAISNEAIKTCTETQVNWLK